MKNLENYMNDKDNIDNARALKQVEIQVAKDLDTHPMESKDTYIKAYMELLSMQFQTKNKMA